MLANYNKILQEIAVHATTRVRCCSESSFSSFHICFKLILPTRSSWSSEDLFLDVCICVGHNRNQFGKGAKCRVTI